jgi:hypothetical protein
MPTYAKSTASQRAEVKRPATEGVSLREIAVLVFGDARYKGRVERILKRPAATTRMPPAADDLEGIDLSWLSTSEQIRLLFERRLAWLLDSQETVSMSELRNLLEVQQILTALEQRERIHRQHRRRRQRRPCPAPKPNRAETQPGPAHSPADPQRTAGLEELARQFGIEPCDLPWRRPHRR